MWFERSYQLHLLLIKFFSELEQQEEEQVDEPAAEKGNRQNDETAADEDDMGMPVPQVKVGPDGQIILDEKSLVG